MILKSRRASREAALQALYGCDMLQDFSAGTVDLYFEVHHPGADSDAERKDHYDFSRALARGAAEMQAAVDALISAASAHWSIHRMCKIDRNILRLGAYEIGFIAEIPVTVSINEAIELAKIYGGTDSPNFVNGVIDQIARNIAKAPEFAAVMSRKPAHRAANG